MMAEWMFAASGGCLGPPMLYALILKPFGILAVIVGAITMPTPLPFGAPLIALGLAILVSTSSTVRGWMRTVRRRSERFDALVRRMEPHLGRRLGVMMRRTRPISRAVACDMPQAASGID